MQMQNRLAAKSIGAIALGWMIAKAISYKLWLADRLFPLVPVWGGLHVVPHWMHLMLFVVSICLLLALLRKPLNRSWQIALLCTELVSCLLDQNRWQPWQYQYMFCIALAIADGRDKIRLFKHWIIIIGATYFYSGCQKLNPYFIHFYWDNFLVQQVLHTHQPSDWLVQIGYLLPISEIVAGALLLVHQWSKQAAMYLMAMHAFNLLVLGPFGLNYNAVVWPWNIVMMYFLYSFFVTKNSQVVVQKDWYRKASWLVIGAWLLLPATNFVGWWDFNFSSSLYSYRSPQMKVCLSKEKNIALQPYFVHTKYAFCDSTYATIDMQAWAMKELKVPPNPERRVYLSIQKQMQQQMQVHDAIFYWIDPPYTLLKARLLAK